MENTAYNRHIAEQVKAITNRYIADAVRKGAFVDEASMATHRPVIGRGFFDDFASGFTKGFAMPFQAVSKLVGGEKKTRGRPRKMAGAISTGGISTGGRRKKMTKEGAGFLDDVLNIATKVAPLALALGKPKKGKKMGGEIALNLREEHFSTPSAVGNMPVAGRRRRMRKGGISTGGISTGGISTGGLSRKLLGARAVGSGYAELEGAGFFDDVLEGIGNVGKLVTTGVDVADKLGLLKKGKGRKMKKAGAISTGGISTGGKRGASKWVQHVKATQKKHNISYKDALKQAKASYKS